MKRAGLIFIILIVFLLVLDSPTNAHPGNTASDGCHYCRTNCESWGEVYGARHCHGGGIIADPEPIFNDPTNTPFPTRVPTRIPTRIPTKTPTPTATKTPTLTPSPSEEISNLAAEVEEEKSQKEGFWAKLLNFLFGN